ncbi:MAG TPA: hypothetical protein DDW31_07710 [candidate division Zixibacteria bacterium]|nr:hypothetical protein [candidate division Zixibacteria bacterium]
MKLDPRQRKLVIIAAALLLAGILIAANLLRGSKSTGVQAAAVRKGQIVSTVSAPGSVKAETEVKISAYVMGKVTRLPVKEGDRVRKGQVLVQIDPANYEAQVKQARASLDLAQASLAQSGLIYERNRELFGKGLLSQEAFEQVATQHRLDQARLAQAQAALDQAMDTYRKTTITSPIDGTVVQLNVELGEVVVTGTMNNPGSVIMTVSDMAQMEVEAQVDESDVRDIAPGQPAEVSIDAMPGRTFKGQVSQVGNAAVASAGLSSGGSTASVNYVVRVRILDQSDELRSGMSANVEITTASKTGILVAPIQSVVMRQVESEIRESDLKNRSGRGKPREGRAEGAVNGADDNTRRKREREQEVVYLARDGKAAITPVKTGIFDQEYIEVLAGLEEGQQVIKGPFRALRNLKHNDRLKITKEQARPGDGAGRRGE